MLTSFNLYKQQGKGEIEKIGREGAIKIIEVQQKERNWEKQKQKLKENEKFRLSPVVKGGDKHSDRF